MSETNFEKQPTSVAKEIWKYLLSLIILGVGVGILAAMYMLRPIPEDRSKDVLIPLVNVYEAQAYTGTLDREISGTVVPFREIKVATQVAGTVAEKYDACQAGNFVEAGTPLLKIDEKDFILELESIKHEVTQSEKTIAETVEEIKGAERNLQLAQSEYEIQELDYKRNERLGNVLSKSEQAQAQRALLNAETNLTARKNTLNQLKARKERLESALTLAKSRQDIAELNLKRTLITAPDRGIIVSESVEKGDYVPRGTILFVFEDTSQAEIVCNLTTSDLQWIRENAVVDVNAPKDEEVNLGSVYRIPKTEVKIFDRDHPGATWKGTLERFDGIGRDESTKTMPARIVVNNPIIDSSDGKVALVRGMYVKCKIEVQTSASSSEREFFTFPEVATRPDNYVWVVRDMKLKRVPITIIDRVEGTLGGEAEPFVVVINDGKLLPNDQIVTSPISQPTEGAIVELESSQEVETVKDTSIPAVNKTAEESKEVTKDSSETT